MYCFLWISSIARETPTPLGQVGHLALRVQMEMIAHEMISVILMDNVSPVSTMNMSVPSPVKGVALLELATLKQAVF